MRYVVAFIYLGLAANGRAQSVQLPDAPAPIASSPATGESTSSADFAAPADQTTGAAQQAPSSTSAAARQEKPAPRKDPLDANGEPIPLERQQPQRILGFMPNFRSVSGGAAPHPPGWRYNFVVATRQATDYSSFIFLGITSLTAEGLNEHPASAKASTASTPTPGAASSTRPTAHTSPRGCCPACCMRTRASMLSARDTRS